ncbi:hypothetical protein BMS3Bbin06_01609 [bacterium BMS3Bbin06]|nr:hypothetical protein BMS3Bbin06_01609 [bacterium BMS3Bbin06]
MKWRIKESYGNRQTFHLLENAFEIPLLHREEFFDGPSPPLDRIRQYHLTNRLDPVSLKEHVFGSAESDTFSAEAFGHL